MTLTEFLLARWRAIGGRWDRFKSGYWSRDLQ